MSRLKNINNHHEIMRANTRGYSYLRGHLLRVLLHSRREFYTQKGAVENGIAINKHFVCAERDLDQFSKFRNNSQHT